MTRAVRIELIEDDLLLARQFYTVLSREGHELHHSCHAGEAMMAIDEQLPDVIILDLLLPAATGFALLHELQSYDDTRNIPVIVCSSVQLTPQDMMPYGIERTIDKATMRPDDLVAAVRAVVL